MAEEEPVMSEDSLTVSSSDSTEILKSMKERKETQIRSPLYAYMLMLAAMAIIILLGFSAPVFLIPLNLMLIELRVLDDIPHRAIMYLALLSAVFGDLAMMLGMFSAGMASFCVMHILYATAFSSLMQYSQRPKVCPILGSVLVYVIFGITASYILSTYGDVPEPMYVYMYVYALSVMAISAATLGYRGMIGAFCFVLSDSLIGVRRFLHPKWLPPNEIVESVIIVTYGIAQYLLITSFVRAEKRRASAPKLLILD